MCQIMLLHCAIKLYTLFALNCTYLRPVFVLVIEVCSHPLLIETKYPPSFLLVSLLIYLICRRCYKIVTTEWIFHSGFEVSLLCYIFFDGRGSLFCTSYSVAPLSIIVGASMDLHSGCSRAVELPYVWGEAIYMLLVSFWWGMGLLTSTHATLLLYPRSIFAMSNLFVLGCSPMHDFMWIVFTYNYGVSLLRYGGILLTCDYQRFWYELRHLVLNKCHLLFCGGIMIKFWIFPKYLPSCY